jgi:signal transduction histidine kinase
LIEDNPGDADLVREHLHAGTAGQFQLTWSESLAEGLCRAAAGEFDVVLLDLSLPDARGLVAVRAARAACRLTPVVVLTGLEDESVALESLREGARDYLNKGRIDGPLLVRAVRYATERALAEESVRRTEERLWQTQKMEAIGQLAGQVARDVNNQMNVITGFGQLLLNTFGPEDRSRREVLGGMLRAAERTAAVARQMLAFDRKHARAPVVLDLNLIVSGFRSMLRPVLGVGVELVTDLARSPLLVEVDPQKIEQILLQLASNARNAMPTGGRLTFRTRYCGPGRGGDATPARAELVVSDTGCGMDAATRTRALEPFFAAKGADRGAGPGLATVQSIVKQVGGEIAIHSEPGRGTEVHVFLPMQDEQELPVRPGGLAAPNAGAVACTETILVADDESAMLTLTRLALENCGYTVLTAATGAESLSVADHHAGPIHLLLTDAAMPEMNGRELARLLTDRRPDLKVLYSSGYTEGTVTREVASSAGSFFLQKPFTPGALTRKVREVLDGKAPAPVPQAATAGAGRAE